MTCVSNSFAEFAETLSRSPEVSREGDGITLDCRCCTTEPNASPPPRIGCDGRCPSAAPPANGDVDDRVLKFELLGVPRTLPRALPPPQSLVSRSAISIWSCASCIARAPCKLIVVLDRLVERVAARCILPALLTGEVSRPEELAEAVGSATATASACDADDDEFREEGLPSLLPPAPLLPPPMRAANCCWLQKALGICIEALPRFEKRPPPMVAISGTSSMALFIR